MVENQRNLCRFPYLDNANFSSAEIPLSELFIAGKFDVLSLPYYQYMLVDHFGNSSFHFHKCKTSNLQFSCFQLEQSHHQMYSCILVVGHSLYHLYREYIHQDSSNLQHRQIR